MCWRRLSYCRSRGTCRVRDRDLLARFGYGIGFRPFLNLVETMVIAGIALFGFGFVGELIAGLREENRGIARALARVGGADTRD